VTLLISLLICDLDLINYGTPRSRRRERTGAGGGRDADGTVRGEIVFTGGFPCGRYGTRMGVVRLVETDGVSKPEIVSLTEAEYCRYVARDERAEVLRRGRRRRRRRRRSDAALEVPGYNASSPFYHQNTPVCMTIQWEMRQEKNFRQVNTLAANNANNAN
ncbi:hypothetical protein THAOC_07874, partial [Thalassiosira oceanica]